jgi:hypothetical protein
MRTDLVPYRNTNVCTVLLLVAPGNNFDDTSIISAIFWGFEVISEEIAKLRADDRR